MWIGNFARRCSENALFITAAPLGGRLGAKGLLELCTLHPGTVKLAGSKGREYYDHTAEKVVELDPLPPVTETLLDRLHRDMVSLCGKPSNSVFLGIGSGLQRKFGEITIARNDPTGSVSELASRRFLEEVEQVINDIDPEGILLEKHDTGTDIEIFPRLSDGRSSFSKGHGLLLLDSELDLRIAEGPNLICGDTPSDVPMIEEALNLMSQNSTAQLAVLFVISSEQHRRTPELAEKLRFLCRDNNAHCAILPSPDVLVAALAQYSKEFHGTW
jgi:hypothetical protein